MTCPALPAEIEASLQAVERCEGDAADADSLREFIYGLLAALLVFMAGDDQELDG